MDLSAARQKLRAGKETLKAVADPLAKALARYSPSPPRCPPSSAVKGAFEASPSRCDDLHAEVPEQHQRWFASGLDPRRQKRLELLKAKQF